MYANYRKFSLRQEVAICHYRQMACVHYYALGKDARALQRFATDREETPDWEHFVDIKVASLRNRSPRNFAKRRSFFYLFFFYMTSRVYFTLYLIN